MPSAVRRVGGVGEIFGEELSESFLVKWRHQPLAPSRVVEKWRTKRGKHWTPVYIGAIPKKKNHDNDTKQHHHAVLLACWRQETRQETTECAEREPTSTIPGTCIDRDLKFTSDQIVLAE